MDAAPRTEVGMNPLTRLPNSSQGTSTAAYITNTYTITPSGPNYLNLFTAKLLRSLLQKARAKRAGDEFSFFGEISWEVKKSSLQNFL